MAGLVLVAADGDLSQGLVAEAVQVCSKEFKIVSNGHLLLEELKGGLVPDLILLGLEMPILDGIEVLQLFKHIPQEFRCPIVVIASNAQDIRIREAMKLGADDCLIKPFKSKDLSQCIKDLTFDVSESELKIMLNSLEAADTRLKDVPSIRKRLGSASDLYKLPSSGLPLCAAIPKDQSPQLLSSAGIRELKGKVIILRECGSGWRKVWPRSGRKLSGSNLSGNKSAS